MYAAIFAVTFFMLTAILYTMPMRVLIKRANDVGEDINYITELIENSQDGTPFVYSVKNEYLIEAVKEYNNALNMLVFMRIIGVITSGVSIGLAFIFTPRLFSPFTDIAEAVQKISGQEGLGQRVPHGDREDIFGDLARGMNQTMMRLEGLLKTQQQFLADVSHELRTPLTAVRGNADLMRQSQMYDKESVEVIQEESERMARLVNDLLLLARADTGGLPMRQQRVQLDELLFEVFRKMRVLQKEHNVTLNVKDFDQVAVMGDPDRLEQVLINLVDNAIKYTPVNGAVSMSLSQADGWAKVDVCDSGIGIPAEDIPYIFNRFYRVDKARARAQGGHGLGLSIVEWIVVSHEGRVEVESEVGKGTMFTVFLPAIPDPVEEEDEEDTGQTSRIMVLLPWVNRGQNDEKKNA